MNAWFFDFRAFFVFEWSICCACSGEHVSMNAKIQIGIRWIFDCEDWILHFIELGTMFLNFFGFVFLIVVGVQVTNLDSSYFCRIRWGFFLWVGCDCGQGGGPMWLRARCGWGSLRRASRPSLIVGRCEWCMCIPLYQTYQISSNFQARFRYEC